MKTSWLEPQESQYDGTQLVSLFAYLNHGIQGDSVVAWRGACNIPPNQMVDGEDLKAGAQICGADMVHFIAEIFGCDLPRAVSLQRLLAALAAEILSDFGHRVVRSGDDLYYNDGKLSISIATVSPVSALIHFAVNVTNVGTPVKTASLDDLNVPPRAFAEKLMQAFANEFESIHLATQKVRWVR